MLYLKSLHLKFMFIFHSAILLYACCILTRIDYFHIHRTEIGIETNELTAWQ